MTIIRGTEYTEFISNLIAAKDEAEDRRISLIRSAITTASTLIGLVAVFGDIRSMCISLRILTICSVVLLSLTVVFGLVVCFQSIEIECEGLSIAYEQFEEENFGEVAHVPIPKTFSVLVKVVPWTLGLGVLSLAAGIVLIALCPAG